jgi:hypothetical protein
LGSAGGGSAVGVGATFSGIFSTTTFSDAFTDGFSDFTAFDPPQPASSKAGTVNSNKPRNFIF